MIKSQQIKQSVDDNLERKLVTKEGNSLLVIHFVMVNLCSYVVLLKSST